MSWKYTVHDLKTLGEFKNKTIMLVNVAILKGVD